jgi:hypothetical protein
MKKLSGFFFVACLMTFAIAVTSCGKDGDAGPAGAAGAQGPKGDKGDKGDQGEAGSANVIYSEWLNQTFNRDTVAGVYFTNIAADALTTDVLGSAFVHVYVNLGTADDPAVVSIPYTQANGVYIREFLLTGIIQLVSNANASSDPTDNSLQYRYVIVPGGVAARTANPIDWNDYKQVKAYMGWKD